jgi:hypothetical protein
MGPLKGAMPGPGSVYKENRVGIAFVLSGLCIIIVGRSLVKRFGAEAHYSGIGSFRITRGGLGWFLGYLLVVFGSSTVFVGVMLLVL